MKPALGRLLAIRELMEELAHLDLELRSNALRSIEGAADRQRQIRQVLENGVLEDLAGKSSENWRLKRADSDLAHWRMAKLETMAETARPSVERAREELLAKRMERRQVEILQESEEQREEQHQIRRDQNRIDEWFQSRSSAGDRTRR